VVVGVHGFAEHAGRYDHVGRFLSERGFALYMYDLRGHGRSESPRGYVDRFERFVEDTVAFAKLVKSETGAKTLLLGHSMGGLIAVLAAAELGGELAGLITSSAARRVTVPALVLHGGDDGIVLPYASRKLYEALASADKTLKIYESLRHEIFNEVEREKVLSDVAEWLEKHI